MADKKNAMKPANTLITNVANVIALWAILNMFVGAETLALRITLAFGGVWLLTNTCVWFYTNMVRPSAEAIIKNNK